MMASNNSSVTDFELDDLNLTLDTVVFEDMQSQYQPDQDLFVIYRVNESFKPSSRDWIGLYHQDWENPRDYITFQWAQKKPRDQKFAHLRSILLQTKSLNLKSSYEKYYQLLYITKENDVVGASIKFKIHDYTPDEDTAAFVCLERPTGDLDIDSLTFIESDTTKPKGLLETFELIKSSSEPTSFEPPNPATKYDNKTLTSNFELPKKNLLDIYTTVDPLLKDYLANKERSLVPMAARDVVPYNNTCKPIYTICNNGKDTGVDLEALLKPIATRILGSSNIQEIPSTSRTKKKCSTKFQLLGKSKGLVKTSSHRLTPRGSLSKAAKNTCSEKGICIECKKKRTQIKVIKTRMTSLENEAADLREELKTRQETVDIKDVLLEELSTKVKTLVQEKDNLTTANEELFSEKTRLQSVISENKRLVMNKTKLGKRYQKLNEENKEMVCQIESLTNSMCDRDTQHAKVWSRNSYLEDEVTRLKTQQEELEKFLDDILYTLSLQGYDRLVDTAGNITDLTKKKGSVLELQGWCMKNSKKIERYLSTIAHHETTIEELQVESERLRMLLRENDKKLKETEKLQKEEQEKAELSEKHLSEMAKKLSISQEKEESLSRLLINEKRQKLDMIRKYQESEKAQQNKISSLMKALKKSQKASKCDSAAQAVQVSSTSSTQTSGPRSNSSLTDATEALSKVCSFVTANIFNATHSPDQKLKQQVPLNEDTGRAHSSKRKIVEQAGTSGASLGAQDPAVLSWADRSDIEDVPSSSESVRKSSEKLAKQSSSGRMKKVKVFGGKAKKPRKFVMQSNGAGKARSASSKDYTPCVFGPKPAPFK